MLRYHIDYVISIVFFFLFLFGLAFDHITQRIPVGGASTKKAEIRKRRHWNIDVSNAIYDIFGVQHANNNIKMIVCIDEL